MKAVPSFCFLLLLCSIQTSGEGETYRGAVVEYFPQILKDEAERVEANVAKYVGFIEEAKEQVADIIVFPENGLLTKTIQSPIPNPADRISPCDSTTFVTTEAVKKLSCASKANEIYSVVNLLEKRACSKDDKNCPPRGYYIHNTNVAFDRKGVVVGRYSKFNLYDEPMVNKTESPEMSFFDTDFGVRFGMFTCFDIMFPSPALKLVQKYNITNFVYTTYWFSELPFLTALQVQRGWAETHNVNLLASGVNFPASATFGSGIYNGKNGEVLQLMPEVPTSVMLVADIPKMRPDSKQIVHHESLFTRIIHKDVQESAPEDGMDLLRDHMHLFQSEVIPVGEDYEQKICSRDNFCCDFRVSMKKLNDDANKYTPRAIVFNGVRRFGLSFKGGVQCCGVVLCRGPDIMNCTSRVKRIPGVFEFSKIEVKGDFPSDDSFQIPTTLTDGEKLEPLPVIKYSFKKKRKDNRMEVSMELDWTVTNLQTFGIWGRDFTKDGSAVLAAPGFYAVAIMTIVFCWNFGMFSS